MVPVMVVFELPNIIMVGTWVLISVTSWICFFLTACITDYIEAAAPRWSNGPTFVFVVEIYGLIPDALGFSSQCIIFHRGKRVNVSKQSSRLSLFSVS